MKSDKRFSLMGPMRRWVEEVFAAGVFGVFFKEERGSRHSVWVSVSF